jgi:DNA-binding NarL/FixJ family response regulator
MGWIGRGVGVERNGRIRVFAVDDHHVVLDGIRLQLANAADVEVVGTADTVLDARRRIQAARPDVAIVDVRLPDGSGIELIRDIRSLDPSVACIVFTSYGQDRALFESVVAGAAGFLLKESSPAVLLDGIRRAARGETLIKREVLDDLRARARSVPRDYGALAGLTPQERRILTYVTRGLTNGEIATELGLAEKTIRNYVSNLLGKLGMRNRTQAAAYVASLREGGSG